MTDKTKAAVCVLVLLFGLTCFFLGISMVGTPADYAGFIPVGAVSFAGQFLMFLSFFLTLGSIVLILGVGSPREESGDRVSEIPRDIPFTEPLPDEAFESAPKFDEVAREKPVNPLDQLIVAVPATPASAEERPALLGLTGGLPKRVELFKGTTTVGRGSDCDLMLSSQAVSRRHAEVEWDGQTLIVRDVGSSNKTLVNDKEIVGDRILEDGDVIQIIEYTLEVELPKSLSQTVMIPRQT